MNLENLTLLIPAKYEKESLPIVLKSIENSKMIEYPFYHLFIENIFSDEFYEQLKEKCDNPEKIDTRFQDNKNFTKDHK
jgi:hypothetical protein